MLGRPRGLGLVLIADQPQRPVRPVAQVGFADWAEGPPCLVPQGPLVRVVCDGFGPDRLLVVVVAEQLPVGANRVGPFPPPATLLRILGYRPERLDRPRG